MSLFGFGLHVGVVGDLEVCLFGLVWWLLARFGLVVGLTVRVRALGCFIHLWALILCVWCCLMVLVWFYGFIALLCGLVVL